MFLSLLLGTAALAGGQTEAAAEPDLAMACQWWRDLRLNGQALSWDGKSSAVVLPQPKK